MKISVLLILCVVLTSCFYFVSPVRKMEKALKQGACQQARRLFSSIQEPENKKLRLAEKAAKTCLPLSKTEAIWFYQYLSKREQKPKKRMLFKKELARIYFEEVKNYEAAIELYSFLKKKALSPSERQDYSFRIALAYFEIGKWPASLKQVESLLLRVNRNNDKTWVNKLFLKLVFFWCRKNTKKRKRCLEKFSKQIRYFLRPISFFCIYPLSMSHVRSFIKLFPS